MFTRSRTRWLIRALAPILAMVWASLPVHACHLSQRLENRIATSASEPVGAHAGCEHHPATDEGAQGSQPSCLELGKAGPESRSIILDQPVVLSGFLVVRSADRAPARLVTWRARAALPPQPPPRLYLHHESLLI